MSDMAWIRAHRKGWGQVQIGNATAKVKTVNTFFFLDLFRATPKAYGSSQAMGQIGAVAAGLCHSHSNAGSEPHLQPTAQLMATPDSFF